ncbi:hypothetical protein NP493_150g04006 [Ridgeia piscesae]|uniref:Uncharacterized protein n=1 Tax=Ridgeia piscesae TaxID=27915 RepID=A0AAD9P4J9_RIDPI|nr:hypothetical protein NP493_150g04006 [Ridgeia piscesae]
MSLLWLPYICLTVILLGLLLASFYRFHRKNRNIYRQRGILARHLAQNEQRACPVASGSGYGTTPSERLKDRLLMKGHRVLVFISMGKLRLVDVDKATSSRDTSTVFQMSQYYFYANQLFYLHLKLDRGFMKLYVHNEQYLFI